MPRQNHIPKYHYNEIIDLLWDTFGTESFVASDIKERAPSAYRSQLLRGLVARGILATAPDATRRKNGQTRPRYTFTPDGIVAVKRRRGERVPKCARRGPDGLLSSVIHFFRHRCAHCGREVRRGRQYRYLYLESGAILPICTDCYRPIRDGSAEYWETCLASLIREKYGGRWRLEGDEVVSKCGPAATDP